METVHCNNKYHKGKVVNRATTIIEFRQRILLSCFLSLLFVFPPGVDAKAERVATKTSPSFTLPPSSISAETLAMLVNDSDTLSVKIAQYYQKKRNISEKNIIHIAFDPSNTRMDPEEFKQLKAQVDAKTPANIQAFVLTWAQPYRVGCMSISSAFAFGFDKKYCASGCKPTQLNPYAGSNTHTPFQQYGIRPTMLLAATNFQDAKALIDRGVASDASFPNGAAYLVATSDHKRSVRKGFFPRVERQLAYQLPVFNEQSEGITDKHDVMFYFTGAVFVKNIDNNTYLPGAMADHLTSTGGKLTDSRQMSALRWLQAGATGSYGTVVEPCNMVEKFPNPLVAIKKYIKGNTLIEAYWKSVQMPGQGVFIGEPLAKPYGGYRLTENY